MLVRGTPGVPPTPTARQDDLMRVSIFGWVPFVIFLVAAAVGSVIGYAEFLK